MKRTIAFVLSIFVLFASIIVNVNAENVGGEVEEEKTSTATIRVMSYNIKIDGLKDFIVGPRHRAVIKEIKDARPDSFGVQESSAAWERLFKNKNNLGSMYDSVGSDRDRWTENADIWYRKDLYNVKDWGTFWLSETPDKKYSKSWGAKYTRICTWAVLQNKETGFTYCHANTHLSYTPAEAQINELNVALSRVLPMLEKYPVVFTGDFYIHEGYALYRTMLENFNDARYASTGATSKELTYRGWLTEPVKPYTYDYIFVEKNLTVTNFFVINKLYEFKEGYPSDHCAIYADIEADYTATTPCPHDGAYTIKDGFEPDCIYRGYTGDLYCNMCGSLFKTGEPIAALGHIGGTATCTKKAVCERCGKAYGAVNPENHTGGTATCTEQAVCETCKKAYGELNPDNHINTEIRNQIAATCGTAGYTGDTYCINCNKKVSEGEEIPATGNHKGGIANCTNKAICEICKQEYGELDANNHVQTKIINEKAATINNEGYSGDKVCVSCEALIEKGQIIPKLEIPTEKPTNKPIESTTEKPTNKPIESTTEKPTNKPIENPTKTPDFNKLPVNFKESKEYLIIAVDLTFNQIQETFDGFMIKVFDSEGKEQSGDITVGTNFVIEIYSGENIVGKKTFVLKGDVNSDGKIKTTDARRALRGALNLDKLNDTEYLAADVNNDGNLKATDARTILRGSMNLETTENWLG